MTLPLSAPRLLPPRVLCKAIVASCVLLLGTTSAVAIGLGGRGGGVGKSAVGDSASTGYFDGKSYELGIYGTPLVGFETNPGVTTVGVEGAMVWAVEGGVELRYHPSDKLRLRTELSAMARSPMTEGRLLEYLFELPAMMIFRLSRHLDLSLANHFVLERSKTPPVFIEVYDAASGQTIRYHAVADQLRPGLALHLLDELMLDVGPYLQIKQVNFLENPEGGEPDYRYFDLGGDVAIKYSFRDWVSLRLRYDLARRLFTNVPVRPAAYKPKGEADLSMTRHVLGGMLRARLGPLSLRAGYSLRLTDGADAFYDYLDHVITAGASFNWRDVVIIEASLTHLRRGYSSRTDCEAIEVTPGTFLGSDCTGLPDENYSHLDQRESALIVSVFATVALTDHFGIVATYELEDASADSEDPLVANHRILGGVSFNL